MTRGGVEGGRATGEDEKKGQSRLKVPNDDEAQGPGATPRPRSTPCLPARMTRASRPPSASGTPASASPPRASSGAWLPG